MSEFQPHNPYGNAPSSSTPMYDYSVPPTQPYSYPGVSAQSWQQARPLRNFRPFLLALLGFPFLSLKMFVWPGPATFAKEKDRAGGQSVFFLLLVGAVITGVLAYLWGRVSRLTPGIENLSSGHVIPQQLSAGMCVFLAVGVPFLFLLLEVILYWVAKKRGGQRGSFRAQLYTGLLIEAPLFAFIVAIALVLLYQPALGNSSRLVFAGIAGAFLLYSFLLHVFAVMAVHQVSAGKAALCLALIVVILAALVLLLGAAAESSSDSGGNGHSSGGSSASHQSGDHQSSGDGGDGGDGDLDTTTRGNQGLIGLFCPNCGYRVSLSRRQSALPCPRCGTPMIY